MCELAPTTYYIARAYGAPFKALPIFVTRRFHHHGLPVVRGGVAIKAPKDLEGRKVGVRAYSVTTGVSTRGIPTNDYGLDASKVTWVVDDEEHVTQLKLPPNVVHVPAGKFLAAMMAAARSTPHSPATRHRPRGSAASRPGRKQRPSTAGYTELLPDARHLEAEWYGRTGIYPFHGLMVVKDDILNAHPGIAKALYGAFVEASKAGCLHCDQAPQIRPMTRSIAI